MSAHGCERPLSLEDLVDYSIGELARDREEALEEHVFSCEFCSRALESIVALGRDVAACVVDGRVTATVTASLLVRAAARGARIREYRLTPGQVVPCTAAPEDDFVAIRLTGLPDTLTEADVQVEFQDLAGGGHAVRQARQVPVDVAAREIVLLFPGATVRSYPRSRWSMHARGADAQAHLGVGPYILDHTPWEQLPPSA